MAVTKRATTTKKKASTSPARTTTARASQPTETRTTETMAQPMALTVKKSYMIALIAVIILAGLLYYFRSFFVAAIVNGQPITRFSLIQQLEKQGGKQVLNIAVTKMLIEQEAKKKNISVSQKDIDAEVKKTETSLASQGQTLDQALAAQGMARTDYTDQVRLQLLVQKLVGKDVTVSDKEINDYIEANKGSIPEGSNMDQIKKSVADQLRQQKLSTKIQALIAQLQKDAKITYFVNY